MRSVRSFELCSAWFTGMSDRSLESSAERLGCIRVREGSDVARNCLFEELPLVLERLVEPDDGKEVERIEGEIAATGIEAVSPPRTFALAEYYRIRGRAADCESLLRRLSHHSSSETQVRALTYRVINRLRAGEHDATECEAMLDRAERLAASDAASTGLFLHARGLFRRSHERISEARSDLESARDQLASVPADLDLARVLDSLGMVYEHSGERDRALYCYCRSLSQKALWKDLYGVAVTLGNLGRLHLRREQFELALDYFRDDLRILERFQDFRAEVVVQNNIGQALAGLGRWDCARSALERALDLARSERWPRQEIYVLKDLAHVFTAEGRFERSRELLDESIVLATAIEGSYPRGQVFFELGEFRYRIGEIADAQSAYEDARSIFASVGAHYDEARALLGLVHCANAVGDRNASIFYIDRGISLLSTGDIDALESWNDAVEKLHVSSADRPLPATIGPYRVVSQIGGGAFADVYLGFDPRVESRLEDLAIKVLRLGSGREQEEREEFLRRFRRECKVLQTMRHPRIVRVIDYGEEPGPYIVEEHLPGGDLETFLTERPTLDADAAIDLVCAVLEGVAVLHEAGIVHRDLKPANILRRATGEPVIADLGLARYLDGTALTLQSSVLGTLHYMAPEQMFGEQVGKPADVYACGVILYRSLSGRFPYPGGDLQEISLEVERSRPRNILLFRPGLTPPLVSCLMRSIEKEAERRFASAQEFLDQLQKVRSPIRGSRGRE